MPQFPLVIKRGDYSRSSSPFVLSSSRVPGRDSEAQGRDKSSQWPAFPPTSGEAARARSTNPYRNKPYGVGWSTEHPPALQPLTQALTTELAQTCWRTQWCLQSLSPHTKGQTFRAASPNLTSRPPQGPRSETSQGDAGRGRPLTRIRQSRAHQAQQLPLLLVVALTEELALLEHELVALLQAPLADAAAEAVQVVDALLGAHHQLAGRDGLQAARALHCEQPAGQATGQPAVTSTAGGTRDRAGDTGHQHGVAVSPPWRVG